MYNALHEKEGKTVMEYYNELIQRNGTPQTTQLKESVQDFTPDEPTTDETKKIKRERIKRKCKSLAFQFVPSKKLGDGDRFGRLFGKATKEIERFWMWNAVYAKRTQGTYTQINMPSLTSNEMTLHEYKVMLNKHNIAVVENWWANDALPKWNKKYKKYRVSSKRKAENQLDIREAFQGKRKNRSNVG
jgi:hypothetical protein